jgi:hypothetical protein
VPPACLDALRLTVVHPQILPRTLCYCHADHHRHFDSRRQNKDAKSATINLILRQQRERLALTLPRSAFHQEYRYAHIAVHCEHDTAAIIILVGMVDAIVIWLLVAK